ncbi:MAG: hypothetical protein Kow0081_2550 [Candidatus Dojkabacteria bacterium]
MKKLVVLIIIFFFTGLSLSFLSAFLILRNFSASTISSSEFNLERRFYVNLDLNSAVSSEIIKVEEQYLSKYINNLRIFDYSTNLIQKNDKEFLVLSQFRKPYTLKQIPNAIDAVALENNIRNILGDEWENYGIYIYDFKRDFELGINQDKIFPPMSISKLPVAVMVLREVDKGNLSLDQQSVFTWQDWADPTNVLGSKYIGTSFAVRDYLRFLIIDSDNSSIRKLENLMGGNLVVNEKVKNELGVNHFFRQPHDATPKDIGIVYRGIYSGEFLSPEMNSFLLDLLFNTHPALQDGIPAMLPYGAKIAHKTGQGASNPGFIWADSGIIYGEKTDYVLVILNEKIDIPVARWKVQQISKIVYDTLN